MSCFVFSTVQNHQIFNLNWKTQKSWRVYLVDLSINHFSSVCVYVCIVFVTLTLQNTLLGKAGGSKRLQRRSQTQLVHLLVSSPINTSLLPVRHKTWKENILYYDVTTSLVQILLAWLSGLTVQMETNRAVPSPSSSSSCSLERVFTMKLRMKRVGRTKPRAPQKNEFRRMLLL